MQKIEKIQIIRSSRKTLSLEIRSGGKVIVRAPYRVSDHMIREFIEKKSAWIEKHLEEMQAESEEAAERERLSPEELQELAHKAVRILPERVRYYALQIGVTYGRITIRNQKTRWGSCSAKGNLNFNCLLMLAPPEVQDYVVVHELCHRKEMNHSKAFWTEVEKILPDYKERERWLKKHGNALIRRMLASDVE